jgi:hypothetical protein
MPHLSVESQLEALGRSLVARGLPVPRPPRDLVVLETINEAIAPFRLPTDIVRFWQLVDPLTIHVRPWPALTDPAFALSSWRGHIEEPGFVPEALFPIAYESHLLTFVELDPPDSDTGGALWWCGYGDTEIQLWFAGIEGLLAEMADALDRGDFDRHGDWAQIIEPNDINFTGPPVLAEAPHPVLGAIEAIPTDQARWPEYWRMTTQRYRQHRAPLGPSHTIAELLSAARQACVRARIHGTVERVAHVGGQGAAVTVSDPTGSLNIWCPPEIRTTGPQARKTFEFDVTAPPDPPPVPEGREFAAIGRPDASRIPMRHLAEAAAASDAVAHDVRPVPDPPLQRNTST